MPEWVVPWIIFFTPVTLTALGLHWRFHRAAWRSVAVRIDWLLLALVAAVIPSLMFGPRLLLDGLAHAARLLGLKGSAWWDRLGPETHAALALAAGAILYLWILAYASPPLRHWSRKHGFIVASATGAVFFIGGIRLLALYRSNIERLLSELAPGSVDGHSVEIGSVLAIGLAAFYFGKRVGRWWVDHGGACVLSPFRLLGGIWGIVHGILILSVRITVGVQTTLQAAGYSLIAALEIWVGWHLARVQPLVLSNFDYAPFIALAGLCLMAIGVWVGVIYGMRPLLGLLAMPRSPAMQVHGAAHLAADMELRERGYMG